MAKIFRGRDVGLLYEQLRCFFRDVSVAKPKASRNSSIEAFVVCRHYSPPPCYVPRFPGDPLSQQHSAEGEGEEEGKRKGEVPEGFPRRTGPPAAVPLPSRQQQLALFVACGDLEGFDADRNYPSSAAPLPPVQAPLAPPYATALTRRRK